MPAKLVQGRPNPWTSSFEFRRALTIDAIQKGGGFAVAVRVGGKPRELHRIDPDRVTIETDQETGEPRYRISGSRDGGRIVPWGDVLHVPGIDGTERKTGLPSLLNDAIATDIAMGRHQRSLFENGARPSGYLMPKRQLNKQALDNAISAFELQHSGPDKSGGTMVSPEEFTFEQLTFSSVDAEFSSCRRMAVEDVARGMGCPLPLVGSLDRATWKNVEELNRTFLTFGLMPWLLAWQGALARALLTREEQEAMYFEFVVDGVVKADIRSRYEAFYRATGGAAWLTPNEARGLENRPNIGGGDELRIPLNTAPASEPAQVEQEAEDA
jgi:HK97 family phage portal protein